MSQTEFTYEADLKAHYAAIRARTLNPAPLPVAAPKKPIPLVIRRVGRFRGAVPARLGFQPVKVPSAPTTETVTNRHVLAVPFTVHHQIQLILKAVAKKHGIQKHKIVSERRTREFVLARHEAMWRVAQKTGLSLAHIGRVFKRDHTSVIHALKKHESRMKARTTAAKP